MYEKIHAGVNAALAADLDKQRQFDDGVALATEIKRFQIAGIDTQDQRDTWDFLDAVAFSTVRQLIGLDQLRMATSGAAPIPAAILEWFTAIGVPLSEIYGMSESSGPMTYSPQRNKPGYVGQAIPGCEVKIRRRRRGRLSRSGNVFVGTEPAREDRRDARRRMAALRRHRDDGRRGLPQDRRPQEGIDHHVGREEHQPRQPGGGVEDDPARRAGLRDR